MTKIVILAGGLGTRLREETEFKPKPMVEVGGQPILWHIMKSFMDYGFNDFVIATGYKSNVIKNYFLNLQAYTQDICLNFDNGKFMYSNSENMNQKHFQVSVIDTGQNTNTGERISKLRDILGEDTFICTYGDGLSNVDIRSLLTFHQSHKRFATVTAVKPRSRFGQLEISADKIVTQFWEKPIMDDWVNGGFFVFEPEVLDFINRGDSLESELLVRLVGIQQLAAYCHEGFWYPMDTYREFLELNEMWNRGETPWIRDQT